MMINEHIAGALSTIINNKMRSGLSMLGIIIGVFSIIVLLALGQGTTASIVDRFSSMGANLVTISPGRSNSTDVRFGGGGNSSSSRNTASNSSVASQAPGLIDDNFIGYVKTLYGVKNVSPVITASKQFIYGTYNSNAQIIGVLPIYERLKNLTVINGAFIAQEDEDEARGVIVIGNQLAKDAFVGEDPIGKEVRLENRIFTVIGVLADNSQMNNRVIMPLSTVMTRVSGTHYYSSLDVEVEDQSKIEFEKTFLEQELMRYTGITSMDDANFSVSTLSELLSTVSQVTGTMTIFLGGIAAISLIVGGIGVMNIMLVSVTERTREIGIRKALGAFKSDILMQFLIEALIISILAGIIGIGLSYATVAVLNNFIKSVITTNSITLAFGSVVLIGIIFGILPASKAANLKPIDALRFE